MKAKTRRGRRLHEGEYGALHLPCHTGHTVGHGPKQSSERGVLDVTQGTGHPSVLRQDQASTYGLRVLCAVPGVRRWDAEDAGPYKSDAQSKEALTDKSQLFT